MENSGNMQRDDSIAPTIGFQFVPTEEELIRCFLLRKAMGLPLPSFNPIVEKDLYGEKHPSDVLSDILDSPYWKNTSTKDHKREMYVFTRLSKLKPGKTRIARTNGHGTWEGQTVPTLIVSESTGELIGKRKMLSFEERKGSKRSSTDRWIMHEFSLDGVSLKYDLKYKDYVICRVTKKVSSAKKRSAVEEEEEEEEILCCKKQKLTSIDEPAVDEGNKSMDVLILTNYTAHEESHIDHTDLKEIIDKELEGGSVDVLSFQECNHINQLHNISTKDSQLGNSLDNNDELEEVSGKSADVLPAQQSNDGPSSCIEECLCRPDDEDEQHDDFHLEDGNGSSWCDDILSLSEVSMMYDRLCKDN